MKLKGLLLLSAGLLFGVFLAVLVLFSSPPTGLGSLNVEYPFSPGSQAINFQLNNLSGSMISLDDFRGKPVIINFWATWCAPCKIEMQLLERYARDDQVVILGVNSAEDSTLVEQFVNEQAITFPILLDRDGAVTDEYFVKYLPVTFFVDKEGILRAQHTGLLSEQLIGQYLQQIGVQP